MQVCETATMYPEHCIWAKFCAQLLYFQQRNQVSNGITSFQRKKSRSRGKSPAPAHTMGIPIPMCLLQTVHVVNHHEMKPFLRTYMPMCESG